MCFIAIYCCIVYSFKLNDILKVKCDLILLIKDVHENEMLMLYSIVLYFLPSSLNERPKPHSTITPQSDHLLMTIFVYLYCNIWRKIKILFQSEVAKYTSSYLMKYILALCTLKEKMQNVHSWIRHVADTQPLEPEVYFLSK